VYEHFLRDDEPKIISLSSNSKKFGGPTTTVFHGTDLAN